MVGPREAAAAASRARAAGEATGVLFGRERWGLTNEEVALADEILTFPVNPKFASLNIAQAVLLVAYEWMTAGLDGALPGADGAAGARLHAGAEGASPRPDAAP